jgi:hypothetical protein
MSFYKLPRNELDSLDNEILEKAFETALEAIKEGSQRSGAETDEELEAALRVT